MWSTVNMNQPHSILRAYTINHYLLHFSYLKVCILSVVLQFFQWWPFHPNKQLFNFSLQILILTIMGEKNHGTFICMKIDGLFLNIAKVECTFKCRFNIFIIMQITWLILKTTVQITCDSLTQNFCSTKTSMFVQETTKGQITITQQVLIRHLLHGKTATCSKNVKVGTKWTEHLSSQELKFWLIPSLSTNFHLSLSFHSSLNFL